MTQRHISHPEGLPPCSAGHSARHIHDARSTAAGGGHFVECRCKATAKRPDAETAIAEWRRINRPTRSANKPAAQVAHDNVLQMPLRLAGAEEIHRRAHGSR